MYSALLMESIQYLKTIVILLIFRTWSTCRRIYLWLVLLFIKLTIWGIFFISYNMHDLSTLGEYL